jgi:glycosyltransferase involved in cell wall biosynthesis
VEQQIEKCIDSIVNQDGFKDYELIIVNDGTKDRSIDLISEVVEKYNNIEVINQVNGGLSDARNTGLKYAKGEYISFVDSDDWIDNKMLSTMYKEAEKFGYDMVVCKVKKVYEKGIDKIDYMRIGFEGNKVLQSNEAIEYFFIHDRVNGFAWNKIYKTKLFKDNHIEYPKGKNYEDLPVTFKLIWYSKEILFIDEYYYNYLQRQTSISNTINEKNWDLIDNIESIGEFLLIHSKFNEYKSGYEALLLNHLVGISYLTLKNSENENFKVLNDKFDRKIKLIPLRSIIINKKIPMKNRIYLILAKANLNKLIHHIK